MADVLTAFTLPAQPATGTVERLALGGDGFRSPSAVYVIRDVQTLADGSNSGAVIVQMGLDPNYCSMIGFVTLSDTQASSVNEELRFQFVGAHVATMGETRLATAQVHEPPNILETWLPPAIIIPGVNPGTLSVWMDNVATDLMIFSAQIFIYDIRAREQTPYDLLVAARGGI